MPLFLFKQKIANGLCAAINLDRIFLSRVGRYVFSYHRVLTAQQAESEGVHHSLWISPEMLVAQIKWMQSIGKIVDYKRIVDFDIPNSTPLFTLTFDDGWRDCYKNAFHILIKYNISAHFFLSTDAVNSGELYWPQDIASKTYRSLVSSKVTIKQVFDALSVSSLSKFSIQKKTNHEVMRFVNDWIEELKLVDDHVRKERIQHYFFCLKEDFHPLMGYIMNWEEVKVMQKNGMSFGSHTHNHAILEGLSSGQVEFELCKSKEIISKKLQVDVDSFCYPNGRYSGKEGGVLSRCGFLYAFCLDNASFRKCNDKFYIPRFIVSERNTLNQNFFKLCLLEAPLFRSKPHRPS